MKVSVHKYVCTSSVMCGKTLLASEKYSLTFNMSVWKQRATSAHQISTVSSLNSSFILHLVLCSVYPKNIKTQFMEMSARDRPTLRNTTVDDFAAVCQSCTVNGVKRLEGDVQLETNEEILMF